jgi:hypothetical protein
MGGARLRPEILDLFSLGGPGGPGNPAERWGGEATTVWHGFPDPRGRQYSTNLGFPILIWPPPLCHRRVQANEHLTIGHKPDC